MRTVSNEFKSAVTSYGRQIAARVTIGTKTYGADTIVSMTLSNNFALLSAVMRGLTLELNGVTALESNTIEHASFGVAVNGQTEWIDYGTFYVKNAVYESETDTLRVEAYDAMLQSMVDYDLTDLAFGDSGMTIAEYLATICTRLSWESAVPETFPNSTQTISEEKYGDGTYTFRAVLTEIAQAAGGTLLFLPDGKLHLCYPTSCGETLRARDFLTLSIGDVFGPVNSIVLGRTPQEDNLYRRDEESIAQNGLCEIRIDNNQIMDADRESFFDGLQAALFGLCYETYEAESVGFGYLDPLDRVTLIDKAGVSHDVIVADNELAATQGLRETFACKAPEEMTTDYTAAGKSDRDMNQTILRVNKQAQQIEALVKKTDETQEQVSTMATQIIQDTQHILMTALEDYVKSGDEEAYRQSVKTTLDIMAGQIALDFSTTTDRINDVDSALQNFAREQHKYIRFEDGDIILGEDSSAITLKIENDRISFVQDGTQVAYFADHRLYITDAEFVNSVIIGNFAFQPAQNGSLSFRKVR